MSKTITRKEFENVKFLWMKRLLDSVNQTAVKLYKRGAQGITTLEEFLAEDSKLGGVEVKKILDILESHIVEDK